MEQENNKILDHIEYLQKTNYELMDTFRTGLFWLIGYCERYDIPLPDLDRAKNLILISGFILEDSEFQQPIGNRNKNTDNVTEPNFTIVLYYALRKSRYNGIRLCCFTSSQATKRS